MMSEFEEIGAPLPTALPHEARKTKSPGRVAAARRLNELGLRGPGGRMPVHGIRALEAMLGRGQEPEGKIGALLADFEQGFLADLGGPENASAKQRALCRRLAELELFVGLVKARLTTGKGGPRRLPWARERDILTTHARLSDTFTRIATALGLERKAKPIPNLADYIKAKYGGAKDGDAPQTLPVAASVGDPEHEAGKAPDPAGKTP